MNSENYVNVRDSYFTIIPTPDFYVPLDFTCIMVIHVKSKNTVKPDSPIPVYVK